MKASEMSKLAAKSSLSGEYGSSDCARRGRTDEEIAALTGLSRTSVGHLQRYAVFVRLRCTMQWLAPHADHIVQHQPRRVMKYFQHDLVSHAAGFKYIGADSI